ncbi:isocitrate/isopropylmalate dehydrogenase family protein, partial [Vibrio parahaemolyticus V-223/04]
SVTFAQRKSTLA